MQSKELLDMRCKQIAYCTPSVNYSLGWPKWLKSLGTAGTSAFPILFTKLFWKMAKKFKNFGVLGCLIAVEEMADFTL